MLLFLHSSSVEIMNSHNPILYALEKAAAAADSRENREGNPGGRRNTGANAPSAASRFKWTKT